MKQTSYPSDLYARAVPLPLQFPLGVRPITHLPTQEELAIHRIHRYWLSPLSLVLLLSLTAFATDFQTKHTLYVGCSEPSSYSQLTDAVAAAKPYTLIKVCPGQYEGGSVSNTDYLKIQGEGKPGSAVVNCSLGGNSGIVLNGKYNWVDPRGQERLQLSLLRYLLQQKLEPGLELDLQ